MNFKSSTINDCQVIELPKIHNRSGNLTALNNTIDLPFDIKRVYYTYDIPSGALRGGHAHFRLWQYIVAGSGAFEVVINDGMDQKVIRLDRPNQALLVVPGIWRELQSFSAGAICLVLASEKYDPSDYIYEYEQFETEKGCK